MGLLFVEDEAFPLLAAGSMVSLAHGRVDGFVLRDSAVPPSSLVEHVDYRIESAEYGLVLVIDPARFVQPLKAGYGYWVRNMAGHHAAG